jgi:NAD+ synthase
MNEIDIRNLLKIDSKAEEQKIIDFVQKGIKNLNRDGAVIGLSGGLDSSTCAYLLEKALGKDRILALILPERDSSPINMNHARLVARNLHLKAVEIDMTDIVEKMGVYEVGPEELKKESDWTKLEIRKMFKEGIHNVGAFWFTKVRLRMVHLFYHSRVHNYAVAGTLDKSEWTIGCYDEHGDGVSDITLLRHLYKTQIRQLAKDVGVPAEIIQKPSSADLYGNQAWEKVLGMTYEQLDQILYGIEKGYERSQLTKIFGKELVESIEKMSEQAKFKRSLPLSLP